MAWQHVGEGFLKEIDFGRVWLRLNEADEGEKDNVFGEWKGDAKAFLSQTLVRTSLHLSNSMGIKTARHPVGLSEQV
jgi:hypothetical protein